MLSINFSTPEFFKKFLVLLPLVSLATVPSAFAESKVKSKPATNADIYLYRGLGASYLCNARAAGVEFPKAVGIASATYAQVLSGRHGGFVKSAGRKKLTNKQLFSGAEFQVISGAMEFCPKEVPADIQKKLKQAVKQQKKKKE